MRSALAALLMFTTGAAHAAPAKLLRDQRELPTTDGAIAVGNFEAQLSASKPGAALVGALIERASVFGHLGDYQRALAMAEESTRKTADDAKAWLALASAHAALHQFAAAERDLLRAEQLRGSHEPIEVMRAGVLEANGHSDQTLELRQKRARARPGLIEIGEEACALADLGRFDEAEQRFAEAQDHYRDVSPFPVAWLYFQAGLMMQKQGRLAGAREAFAAVVARLPGHAQASAHLAAVLVVTGERERAIVILRQLGAASDDPEYVGQLAALLDGEEARALRLRAGAAYDALIKRHPEAFADHAARFWLSAPNPAKALTLAERNLTVRQTREAYQLVIDAALAAKNPARACAAADRSLALPHVTATLHLAASRAFAACGQKARADSELAAATAR